ncbi:MAG TPA: class I SAM-dependent methyltransferase [Candidatus Acidoferrales bacterium]|nr:class I SAM-dependent methyltransferase [Candidatus Acidoferrales bacterium]
MRLLDLPRIPEPEVMDDSGEVEAYSSAAAQEHLNRIDDTFVEHAVSLLRGRLQGRALDIGTGPGQIVLKLARRLAGWEFAAVDHSPNMIRQARENLDAAAGARPDLSRRVEFSVADGNHLAFPDAAFDLVMSNSVLHHLAQPQLLLAEVDRLIKPGGAILLRDLRRPSRFAYPWHIRWHGRHYSGTMYQLFCASVRSAYTLPEMESLLRASLLRGARVFARHRSHLGIEKRAE